MTVTDLPVVNATLNGCATVLLVLGFIFIKTRHVKAHVACMISALVVSAAFLSCYLYYHYHAGHVEFPGPASMKTLYLLILIPHIFLAVGNVPMILMTVIPALSRRFDKHKRIAKWTLPIWLYVSVTGVIVYMMCYQWYGPPIR